MLDNTTTFATIGTDYSSSFILMPRRSKSEELLEFEITFYEKLLHAYPDFVDVLLPLGEAYTRRGLYDKGLEIDLKLTQLRTTDSVMWYNLACSYSLLKRVEESADALRRAVTLGYSDLKFLQKDPDLAQLRQSPHYRQILDTFSALSAPKAPHVS